MSQEINPYAAPTTEIGQRPPTAETGNLFLLSAGDATRFVLRHPLAFALFSLGISVPLDLVDTYVSAHDDVFELGERFSLVMVGLANIAATFCWAALTELARQDETGEPPSITSAILVAASTFLTLLVCDIVVGLLLLVGAIFLLLPGLYLAMRFFFLVPIVVVERQSIGRSLQASWQFTESRQLISLIFGILFTLAIVLILGWELLLVGLVWELLPWEDLPEQVVELSWLLQPAWRIPTTLLADWFTVTTFYGYWRLRRQAAEADLVTKPASPASPFAPF